MEKVTVDILWRFQSHSLRHAQTACASTKPPPGTLQGEKDTRNKMQATTCLTKSLKVVSIVVQDVMGFGLAWLWHISFGMSTAPKDMNTHCPVTAGGRDHERTCWGEQRSASLSYPVVSCLLHMEVNT